MNDQNRYPPLNFIPGASWVLHAIIWGGAALAAPPQAQLVVWVTGLSFALAYKGFFSPVRIKAVKKKK